MDFSVARLSRSLVSPSEPTPSGVLDLSVIDRLPVLRCNARTLHIFRHGPKAAEVLRKALSKALVPYYPLAGRLNVSAENQIQITCSGEGIWFVEASANCMLEAVNFFDDTAVIPYDKLLPDPPQESNPLVQMQITQFECGGFVVGLIFSHSICDGLGAAQFLNAVGEMAKGVEQLSINPVWCRDFLPPPPLQFHANSMPADMPPVPPILDYQLEHANIDISPDQINDLKQKFRELTGKNCSSFEIVAASLWSHRARAINQKDDTDMTLVFFANCRHLLNPPLPVGFYGNCFFPVTITVSNQTLTKASNAEIVKLIQEAKAGLPNEFGKWVKGELMKDPFAPPLVYTTMFISEWGRLGFNQVDYGWGHPVHIVPIQGSSLIPVAIVGSVPCTRRGVRLMTWCVEKAHLQPFVKQMTSLI
ncbi:HXXXD-type acyl-transferase family protein [Abeliophyllum distichum]|uniref:HXXXD-type acyl-transferase family protein n=1 Tax=Abeliophyllum distichum TaxID=126358 RepID=A0ABD1TCI8_9LAMI